MPLVRGNLLDDAKSAYGISIALAVGTGGYSGEANAKLEYRAIYNMRRGVASLIITAILLIKSNKYKIIILH